MTRITHAAALTAALLTIGCQSYERQPLQLDNYAQHWRELDTSAAAKTASHLSDTPFDIYDGVSLAEARALALTFNPDLRVQRLRAAVPLAGSKHAGLLDDPELGFDVLRIVQSVDKPWIAGVGIGFTIPLSGRLAVEKDQAWADYTAAWRAVALRESETAAQVERMWAQWSAASARVALLDAHLDRLEPLASTVAQLAEAGELRPIDARRIDLAMADARTERGKATSEQRRIRGSLLALMGFVPDAPVKLTPEAVAFDAPDDAPDAILNHPRLELAKANYEVAELALRRQITKQYPDLTIGPVYENEDGQSHIGLSGAIPLPIFNRNQRGIAEAGAARDAARAEAERTYQHLAAQLAAAHGAYDAAMRRLDHINSTVVPLIGQQLKDVQRLIDIGEVDVLALTDALDRTIAVHSDTLDAKTDAAIAAATLRSLVNPTWVTVRAARQEYNKDSDTDEVQP